MTRFLDETQPQEVLRTAPKPTRSTEPLELLQLLGIGVLQPLLLRFLLQHFHRPTPPPVKFKELRNCLWQRDRVQHWESKSLSHRIWVHPPLPARVKETSTWMYKLLLTNISQITKFRSVLEATTY